jgi:hypothetical protein
MGDVLQGLQEKIANSTKAKAVERAWQVAKTLEADRSQIKGLTWVEPVQEKTGPKREIDFSSEFPEGVETLLPLNMDFQVTAPGNVIVPGEKLDLNWTMPYLVRVSGEEYTPDTKIVREMGTYSLDKLRPTIDIVTFLPFPRADAPVEEQFKPEFGFTISVKDPSSQGDYYYSCVAKFDDKLVKQFVIGEHRNLLVVQADPKNDTYFNGNMLINMSEEELATVTPDSGYIELYICKLVKGIDYKKIKSYISDNIGDVLDYPSSRNSNTFGGGYKGGGSPNRSSGLIGLPKLDNIAPKKPTPAEAPKEVGEVKVGEGTKGEEQKYTKITGYQFDSSFPVQRIRIRILGIREGTQDQVRGELERIATTYQT